MIDEPLRELRVGGRRSRPEICSSPRKLGGVLLLDEPASSLDPAARREFLETSIRLLNESGRRSSVQAAGLLTGLFRPWVVRALVEIPAWKVGGSAVGSLAVWLVAALLGYGAYRVAEGQFLRSEIPTRPSTFSLLERARDESRI